VGGSDLRAATQRATLVAAASVQHPGAQPSYPWADEPLPRGVGASSR
jgi:sugar/nucleoside kinase (ribokinase family)